MKTQYGLAVTCTVYYVWHVQTRHGKIRREAAISVTIGASVLGSQEKVQAALKPLLTLEPYSRTVKELQQVVKDPDLVGILDHIPEGGYFETRWEITTASFLTAEQGEAFLKRYPGIQNAQRLIEQQREKMGLAFIDAPGIRENLVKKLVV